MGDFHEWKQTSMMPLSAVWRDALLILAASPLVYYALAILIAVQFFRKQRARPLPEYSPPVSLLKPVRGVDFGSYENFVSCCQQDYLEYEILFRGSLGRRDTMCWC